MLASAMLKTCVSESEKGNKSTAYIKAQFAQFQRQVPFDYNTLTRTYALPWDWVLQIDVHMSLHPVKAISANLQLLCRLLNNSLRRQASSTSNIYIALPFLYPFLDIYVYVVYLYIRYSPGSCCSRFGYFRVLIKHHRGAGTMARLNYCSSLCPRTDPHVCLPFLQPFYMSCI